MFTSMLSSFSKKINFENDKKHNLKKIFISRGNLKNSTRNFLNYREIEEISSLHGFEIIHPEKMSIKKQIKKFYTADVIVGKFGFGLHNSIFSKPETIIFCLNWLGESNVQLYLAKSLHQHIIIQFPKSGFITKLISSSTYENFEIDKKIFSNVLDNINSIYERLKLKN